MTLIISASGAASFSYNTRVVFFLIPSILEFISALPRNSLWRLTTTHARPPSCNNTGSSPRHISDPWVKWGSLITSAWLLAVESSSMNQMNLKTVLISLLFIVNHNLVKNYRQVIHRDGIAKVCWESLSVCFRILSFVCENSQKCVVVVKQAVARNVNS